MISLLGSLLGFGTSSIPMIMGFFEKKQANKQELLMLEAKAKYASELSKLKLQEMDAQADIEEVKGLYKHAESLAQANKSTFVSALQASVRPVITYAFFSVFAFVKITYVIMAVQEGRDVLPSILEAWDDESQTIFAAIISFWFGNRLFKARSK
jgi:hypothetical protein|tara:strand:+ start:649 stop:1110 length:462 start_codon:yes stop_codon:yes gene_type:complete